MPRVRAARRFARSRFIPTFRASRTASSIWSRFTITWRSTRACCTGTASKFWIGIWRRRTRRRRRPNERRNEAASGRHAADGAHHLLADRRTRGAEAAGRRAHGGVVHRERGGMGHQFADAAHGADATGRRRALARYSELGLARVRQPRRLLAHAEGVRRIQ